MSLAPGPRRDAPDERPPLGSWGALYAVVVIELALVIVLLGWLTRAFS